MALKVWLPLSGDTTNYGLTDAITEASTGVQYTNGILGKRALSTSIESGVCTTLNSAASFTKFAISGWIKENTGNSDGAVIAAVQNADSDVATLTKVEDGYQIAELTNETLFELTNGWNFFAVTADGTTVKAYLNGALVKETAQSGNGILTANKLSVGGGFIAGNGSTWTQVSTLPYEFYNGSVVVYNNEIHILGRGNSYTNHYKWNGSTWTQVSTLPYPFYSGSAVVYNNEIHILGTYDNSNDRTKHYKWNGSTWTQVSTLPYEFYNGSAVVYNNEIHILGSSVSSNYNKHYKWNGSTWTQVSTLPYPFYTSSAVVYNNEIHILGGGGSNDRTKHYKWNGSTWTQVSTLPYGFYNSSAVVYNNEIHILGSSVSSNYNKHYKWNGSTWTQVSTLPYGFYNSSAVVYNNEIHILGTYDNNNRTKHYELNEGTPIWSGSVCNVKLYDSVLSLFEVVAESNALVVNYSFNGAVSLGTGIASADYPEGTDAAFYGFTGNKEYDLSGNGFDGTFGTKKPVTASDTPMYSSSYNFSSADPLTVTINSSEFRTRYTVSVWAKGTGNAVSFSNGSTLAVSDSDVWHNIVVTSDGKKYVDGVDSETVVSGLIGNGTCDITIGGEAYSGKLSDFRIYAKKMSADEIAALYKRKAAIDNSGKLIAAEIVVEDEAPASFSKAGVVTAAAMNNWTGESDNPVDVNTFSILQTSGAINASDVIEF